MYYSVSNLDFSPLYLHRQRKRKDTRQANQTPKSMQTALIGDKRTTALPAKDRKNLNNLIKVEGTKTAAAKLLDMSRQTLTTILKSGTLSPDTLQSIQEYFSNNEQLAA